MRIQKAMQRAIRYPNKNVTFLVMQKYNNDKLKTMLEIEKGLVFQSIPNITGEDTEDTARILSILKHSEGSIFINELTLNYGNIELWKLLNYGNY